jgi:hypothetical protein
MMTPAQQLDGFLSRYTPEVRSVAEQALVKLRKLLPGAVELVYDNYNALVIAFGPTERPSDLMLSIALYPRWVTLFFTDGTTLPDPEKLLKGGGKFVRQVRLDGGAADLDRPAVKALIAHAAAQAEQPFGMKRRLVIQSISPKQRPRRPA